MKAYELAAENKGMREEVERLRHDIERHVAIASELATENERLRAELAKADGQINRCVEQNKYLESTISRLLRFAYHEEECAVLSTHRGPRQPCDCGYDALMKEIGG